VAELTFDLPDLGEGLIDATVLEWFVVEGDYLERGAPMVEVETTKSTIELPSPQAGVISKLHVDEGASVDVGTPLVTFTVADDQAGIVGTVPDAASALPTRRVRLSLPED
jgi:pyruvate/2-oxoglutarate dehydrogenase complex dihydrolipoamide acyltransferase (E2) component